MTMQHAQKQSLEAFEAARAVNPAERGITLLSWNLESARNAGYLGKETPAVTASQMESVACCNALIGWG